MSIVGIGPLLSELKKCVSDLNLCEVVSFEGALDQLQIAEIYSKSDTLVLPSTNEVWGLVANEALASGLHVVVSKVAGVSQFAEPMEGVFVSGTSPEELSFAMTQSRASWQGPIIKPKILDYTPQIFAKELINLTLEG